MARVGRQKLDSGSYIISFKFIIYTSEQLYHDPQTLGACVPRSYYAKAKPWYLWDGRRDSSPCAAVSLSCLCPAKPLQAQTRTC